MYMDGRFFSPHFWKLITKFFFRNYPMVSVESTNHSNNRQRMEPFWGSEFEVIVLKYKTVICMKHVCVFCFFLTRHTEYLLKIDKCIHRCFKVDPAMQSFKFKVNLFWFWNKTMSVTEWQGHLLSCSQTLFGQLWNVSFHIHLKVHEVKTDQMAGVWRKFC